QYDCWIILLLNANLPPDQRVKKENLMITAIIPGPKSPKNFNSFLQLLVDELKCLEAGISCYDELSQETFILRGHVLSWSGDIPALSKVMCVPARHVYFLLSPPKGYNGKIYNPNKLLMRSHTSYLQNIKALENKSKSEQYKIERETGVNGHSVLFEL
ncbi:46011_t:CDS:2, partial [Gigaspora margarita]